MIRPTSMQLSGVFSAAVALSLLLAMPGQAEADDRWAGESLRSDRVRATETLNPRAIRDTPLSARERATVTIRGDQASRRADVQVIRQPRADRSAYVYEVNGQRRVSVAEPRRVDHQPVRLQDQRDRFDAIERAAAERAARYNIPRSAAGEVEVRDNERMPTVRLAGHETETVLQEVDSYSYPRAAQPDARVRSALPSQAVHVTHAAPRHEARDRAEVAVRQASHQRHVQREVYAGYRHTPRSRVSTSIRLHTSHASATYHHPYTHHAYSYSPPVRVHHYHHYPAPPRWRTGIHRHHVSRFHCPSVRRHHHHHRSGASVSLHLRF